MIFRNNIQEGRKLAHRLSHSLELYYSLSHCHKYYFQGHLSLMIKKMEPGNE